MVQYTIADEMPHTTTPDIGFKLYDCMSKFSRGNNGEVVYVGGVYKAK
ncbi:hypothetical protein SDC9_174008 [bioreactor metagenome]|uniref:Uncharacterized protein n=1 Tax=bioreactor metagenome TaxID=1076179 RepID=A0A645GSH7_9ZZZZ|nr:hypothetical protein [Lachnospiraceae bacterium]